MRLWWNNWLPYWSYCSACFIGTRRAGPSCLCGGSFSADPAVVYPKSRYQHGIAGTWHNGPGSGGGAPAEHLQLAFRGPITVAVIAVEHKLLHHVSALFRVLFYRFPALNMANGLGIAPDDFQLHGRTPRPGRSNSVTKHKRKREARNCLKHEGYTMGNNAGHGPAQPARTDSGELVPDRNSWETAPHPPPGKPG